MEKKDPWTKPALNKLTLGVRCNPARPQINICEQLGIPQEGISCAGNKVGLS